ncbi:MAG: GNAT family N-acetyltransferase [Promicromonosporaceae bacterium]|nr:GNAT family N-acetyltransferase [Promicromonosporaceae bacterium]
MNVNLPIGYRIEQLTPDRLRDVMVLDTWAFPHITDIDEVKLEELSLTWERTFGVVPPNGKPGEIVGMYGTHPFRQAAVPGATISMGGLTWVSVHPQHRRKGLLNAMIDHHFTTCIDNGEPIAGLFAAEMAIYGRYGFGVAGDHVMLEIPRQAELRPVTDSDKHTVRVEMCNPEAHEEMILHIHAAQGQPSCVGRPGWVTFETPGLRSSMLQDPSRWRGGKESRRIVIVERDGEPRGYALLRRGTSWSSYLPQGKVEVREALALDAAAEHALWKVLLDFDLMKVTDIDTQSVDARILNLLVNRRAALPKLVDNQWIRIIDLPAALTTRKYQADLDVVLDVTDERLPANAGNWRLQARAFGEATCVRTDSPAEVTLDVRELGSIYLGGRSLAALATAGLANDGQVTDAVMRTSAAFGWPLAPAAMEY